MTTKELKGPTSARTPAKNKAFAAKHAQSVAHMASTAKVSKPTTGQVVKTKGLKGEEPRVKLDTMAPKGKAAKPVPISQGEAVIKAATSTGAKGKLNMPKMKEAATDLQIKGAQAKTLAELEEEFESFFRAEIEAELEREAEIFHDRVAKWRCQCCDALILIPRRTMVLHGDYVLVHDDLQGLLVNGERFVPKATEGTELKQPGRIKVDKAPIEVYTPEMEVKQPGRFKDPYRHLR